MAVGEAAALVLAACALTLTMRGSALVEQLLASLILIFAFSGVLSYLYGAAPARPSATTQVSAQSVVGFIALGMALLLFRPTEGVVGHLLRDEPGSFMARSLLVAAATVLPLLGGLRLAGEEAGFYGSRGGVGIMVIVSFFVLVATAVITARRLNALGRQRSAAMDQLAGSERRLRRAPEQLVQVQENERRALAMDLHDDALPQLAAVALELETARSASGEPDIRARLARTESELRAASSRLRHLMFDLLPEALAREGLATALRHRLERMRGVTGVDYELYDRIGQDPSVQSAAILYRITLEALRNVARHAQATLVQVAIERRDGRIEVRVSDDGVGIDPSAGKPGHVGLTMMAQRAELAGGGLEVHPREDHGTVVEFWIPAATERGVQMD